MSNQTPRLRDLLGQTAIYALADAVGKALSLILFPIFTRVLTPAEYGVVDVISTVTALAGPLLVLGLDSAATRYFFAPEFTDRRDVVLGSALLASVVSYSFGGALLLASHGVISRLLFGGVQYAPALALAFAAVPFSLLTAFALQTFRRLLKPWPFAVFSLASLLLTIGSNLILVWWLRWGVRGIYASNLIAGILTASTAIWTTRRYYRLQWDRPLVRTLLRFGLPLIPSALLFWALSLMDRLFLVRLANLNEVGLYSTANRLASILAFGVAAFQVAWAPFAYSISSTTDAGRTYARVLNYYLAWGGFAALGLGLFAPDALAILTPPQYHSAAIAVAPLALGALGYGAFVLVAIGVNLANRTAQVSITLAIASATNLVLCVLAIPRFGMLGAAYATLVSWVVAAVHLGRASQRVYHIPYEWARVASIVALLVVCLAVGLLSGPSGQRTWLGDAMKTAVVLGYLAVLKSWRLVPELDVRQWLAAERAADA